MMQLGGNALICPWFRTRVQEQPLCSKADWPVYLQTWANHQPPRYEVAGFSKCSILFCCVPSRPGQVKCGRCNHCGCRCNAAGVFLFLFFFFLPSHSSVHIGLFCFHITFKCLKFILIKRCLPFSPLGPECYLYLSNLCSNRGRSEKLLINLLL